uniref:Uncharacterized protein n=1 Tax=Ananas comosus var. bracteatus TaxID=296719 RepID=A0A6V7QUY7_ANACO
MKTNHFAPSLRCRRHDNFLPRRESISRHTRVSHYSFGCHNHLTNPSRPVSSLPNQCARPSRRRAAPAAEKGTPVISRFPSSPDKPRLRSLCSGERQSPSTISPRPRPSSGALPRRPPSSPRAAGRRPGSLRPPASPRPSLGDLGIPEPPTPPLGRAALLSAPATSGNPARSFPRRPRAPPAAAGTTCGRPDLCGPRLGPLGFHVSPPPTEGCTALPSTSAAGSSPSRPPPAAAAPPGRANPRESGWRGSLPPRHRLPPAAGHHHPRTSRTECSLLRPDRPLPGRRRPSLAPTALSGDRRDSCTGGYFDPTLVQWCTLGDGTHFTNTSGLIHRKRVFFSGKVVSQAMSSGTRREVRVTGEKVSSGAAASSHNRKPPRAWIFAPPILRELSEIYGPLMRLKLGLVSTIVVSFALIAEEVLKTQDKTFCFRPPLSSLRKVFYGGLDIAFTPYTAYLKYAKKICVTELLCSPRVQLFRPIREGEVGILVKTILRSRSRSEHSLVNLSEMFLCLLNNITCRQVLGRRFAAEGECGRSRFHDMVTEWTDMMGHFNLGEFFPSLEWINLLSGLHGRFAENFRAVDAFLNEVVEARMAEHEEDGREADRASIENKASSSSLFDCSQRIQQGWLSGIEDLFSFSKFN